MHGHGMPPVSLNVRVDRRIPSGLLADQVQGDVPQACCTPPHGAQATVERMGEYHACLVLPHAGMVLPSPLTVYGLFRQGCPLGVVRSKPVSFPCSNHIHSSVMSPFRQPSIGEIRSGLGESGVLASAFRFQCNRDSIEKPPGTATATLCWTTSRVFLSSATIPRSYARRVMSST